MQDHNSIGISRLLLYIGQGVLLTIMFIMLVIFTHLVAVKSSSDEQLSLQAAKVALITPDNTKNKGDVDK